MNAAEFKIASKRRAEEYKYKIFLEECKATDLSDIKRLEVVSAQAGADLLGRRIVTITLGKNSVLLKTETGRKKLLMYTIMEMDSVAQEPYVIVYCHSEVNLIPLLMWFRKVYALLPRKFKKNLKQLFILHPTKWVEAFAKVVNTLGVSKKLWQKVHYPHTIAELQRKLQPMPDLPKFVHDADVVRVEKLKQHEARNRDASVPTAKGTAAMAHSKPLGLLFKRPLIGMPCFKVNGQMPKAVEKLADYLQQQICSRVEGLFRIPAEQDLLNQAKDIIDKGGLPDFLTNGSKPVSQNVHVAAGLYKFFYRKLPEPLIPVIAYRAMIVVETQNDMDKVLAREIAAMPMEHRFCLLHLLDFLSLIAFEDGYNKMTKANLAMVFAPSVLRDPEASPMQEMATIKSKVDILHYLLERYKSKNLFRSLEDDNAGAASAAAATAVTTPPIVPPRSRPKALPKGSMDQLSAQLARLSRGGGGASIADTTAFEVPVVPPRNRPKTLPKGSVDRLNTLTGLSDGIDNESSAAKPIDEDDIFENIPLEKDNVSKDDGVTKHSDDGDCE